MPSVKNLTLEELKTALEKGEIVEGNIIEVISGAAVGGDAGQESARGPASA